MGRVCQRFVAVQGRAGQGKARRGTNSSERTESPGCREICLNRTAFRIGRHDPGKLDQRLQCSILSKWHANRDRAVWRITTDLTGRKYRAILVHSNPHGYTAIRRAVVLCEALHACRLGLLDSRQLPNSIPSNNRNNCRAATLSANRTTERGKKGRVPKLSSLRL